MRLLSYKLKNWGPHREQSLEFPTSSKTLAICGENDKGKSWIVRGIGFTLSIGRNEYGDQSSIHSGEQEAHHELVIEQGNSQYKIEKLVKGKGSEEEGTITKIDGKIVNRLEYEEFYKNNLGLPHPSIWLPICISMQNETDFHLRSKKRDREEALRAICQLNKIDNWKDTLNQLQKEEEKTFISQSSRLKGLIEQVDNELKALSKKEEDLSLKLSDLKSIGNDSDETNDVNLNPSWEEIIRLSARFEEINKEVRRKTLEKSNILKQINLTDLAILRTEKELQSHQKETKDVQSIEQRKKYLRFCLWHLRLKSLKQQSSDVIQKRLDIEKKINEKLEQTATEPSKEQAFSASQQEEILGEIAKRIVLLDQTIKKTSDIVKSYNIETEISIAKIKKSLLKKKNIKELLVKSLSEEKTRRSQRVELENSTKSLCECLGIESINLVKDYEALENNLLKGEVESLGLTLRGIINKSLSNQADNTPVSCPVCQTSIVKGMLEHAEHHENSGDMEGSKLKMIFSLSEKVKSLEELQGQCKAWETDFENTGKLENEILALSEEISALESLERKIKDILQHSKLEEESVDILQPPDENTDALLHGLKTKSLLKQKEKLIKNKISSYNEIFQLRSELKVAQKEEERTLQQIKFYEEEEQQAAKEIKGTEHGDILKEDLSSLNENTIRDNIQTLEKELSTAKELSSMIESKRKEILNLKAQEKSCENQIKELDAFLLPEIENLKKGYNLPIPKGFQPTSEELIERWDEVSCEWQKRCQESEKTKAVFNSIAPRIKELQNYKAELKEELKKEELVAKRVTCAKKVVNFLDYKHAPRKLLEGVVTNLFDLTNRLGESLNVDIKLKLGKNLEFLTLQSRAGRWIEQKTERLGFGKGAILGICFRLACQRLLLPETGFLILDEPTANVDLKRKGLFKLFLQNLSEDSHIGTKARTSQIILIEHDEDVVELCQTKIDIKDKTA